MTYLFIHKGFCTVYFRVKEKNEVTLPHSAQRRHTFLGEIKEISKTKLPSRKKIALELLRHRLGHRTNIPLWDEDTANVWEDIELRLYPDPFCTSFHISDTNKNAMSKNPLKPKAPLKWVLMAIIQSTAPKRLTSDTTFSNCPLTFDFKSKIPKLYGIDKFST